MQQVFARTVGLVITNFLTIGGHDYKLFIFWYAKSLKKSVKFKPHKKLSFNIGEINNKREKENSTAYLSCLFLETGKIKNAA